MAFQDTWARLTFTADKKIRLLRQLQRMTRAGISLNTSLDTLYKLYSRNGKDHTNAMAMACNSWRKRINAGSSLSQAMSGWVTKSEEMIIEAGEQSNNLDRAMNDALAASQAGRSIRKAVIGAMAYPVALFFAMCAMLYGFATGIVPTFADAVDPRTWTGNAARMYSLANFVTSYLPLVLAGVAVFVVAVGYLMPRWKGTGRTFFDNIPPFSIYKVIVGASFLMSMRGFIAAGVKSPDALRRISRTSSPFVKDRTSAILAQVNAGRNLGEAMDLAGHKFPDPAINGEISIYAGLDGFADNLDMLAREWIDDSVVRVQQASKVMGNVMLVLLAAVIAFMVFGMMEMQDIITRSANNPIIP